MRTSSWTFREILTGATYRKDLKNRSKHVMIRWCYLCGKCEEDVHTVDLVSRKQGQVHVDQFDGVWFGDPQRILQGVAEL